MKAGSLEWDVERTVVHILGSLAKHTLYLASRTSRYIAWSGQKFPGATHADLIHSVERCGRALGPPHLGACNGPAHIRSFGRDCHGSFALQHAPEGLGGAG